ncbi:profilin family protein [Streptomyces sp. NPDC060035]|uniref:profilin family protein n=1 Tax=Streptomyces sp. NPDC060035 TaxID=3347044 RepID=UPI00368345C8
MPSPNPGALQGNEGRTISEPFKNPADVFAKGITVSGVKYMRIKGDDTSIYNFDHH